MAGKKGEPSEPFQLTRNRIVAGVGIFVFFALVGIVAFTYFGDPSVSKSKPTPQYDVPAPAGPEPTVQRSAAADLLGGKSFADMSQDEIALVKSEVAKAFDNAQFRTTNSLKPLGLDIFRIDGVTRVTRQYESVVTIGQAGEDLQETRVFFCDDPSGKVDAFQYTIMAGRVRAASTPLNRDQLPFTTTISALDWSQPEDLGFDTIDGHRVHGVAMPLSLGGPKNRIVRSEQWFDVASARLIARKAFSNETDASANVQQLFDWRRPQPVAPPPDQPVPPCAEQIYDALPSARPPATETPSAPTAATATPASASTPAPTP